MSPSVPFRPRSLEAHRPRYVAALVPVYDMDECGRRPELRPGIRPEHVFDFSDGLRLLISRDRLAGGRGVITHCSASAITSTAAYLEIETRMRLEGVGAAQAWFCATVLERWRDLAGGALPGEPEFKGFSPGKGVPHWFLS